MKHKTRIQIQGSNIVLKIKQGLKKTGLFLLLFLGLGLHLYSQDVAEILYEKRNKIKQLKEDSFKVESLINLSKDWIAIDIDSTLDYSKKATQLSSQLNYKKGKVHGFFVSGLCYAKKGQYEAAISDLVKGLAIAEEIQDRYMEILSTNALGVLHAITEKYEESLAYHQKSMEYTKIIKTFDNITDPVYHLVRVYPPQILVSISYPEGVSQLNIKETSNLKEFLPTCLFEVGLVYERMGNLEKAIEIFNQALKMEQELGEKANTATILNTLAATFQKTMNPHVSIQSAETAFEIAKKNKDYTNMVYACNNLAQCYMMLKKYEKALEFHELAKPLQDSLMDMRKEYLISGLQSKFKIDKLGWENQLFKEKEVFYEKELWHKGLMITLCAIALFFAISLIFALMKFNATKTKINQLLQKQNKEIESQKEVLQTQSNELQETLQKLKMAQSQLVHSEKMASLGQLTAGIAHEINNPVNFIYAGIGGLKKNLRVLMNLNERYSMIENGQDFDKKILEINEIKTEIEYDEVLEDIDGLMESITDGAERAGGIVKSLQAFSRFNTPDISTVNIHQCLDNTLTLLKSSLTNIEIEKDYELDLTAIEANQGQLNQVFMNILTNAIQAIDEQDGIISITTKNDQENVVIIIADNGPGLPESIKQKIFEPFFTTKKIGKGTGLGLSISYGIIKDHGGTIELDCQEGTGATFCIILPIQQDNR